MARYRTELSDADHEEILDNPEQDQYLSRIAIEDAVRDGMTLKAATQAYGVKPVDEDAQDLDVEDYYQLLRDALDGCEPSIRTQKALHVYNALKTDLVECNGVPYIPND